MFQHGLITFSANTYRMSKARCPSSRQWRKELHHDAAHTATGYGTVDLHVARGGKSLECAVVDLLRSWAHRGATAQGKTRVREQLLLIFSAANVTKISIQTICLKCGGEAKVIASIEEQEVIDKILLHLQAKGALPSSPDMLSATRASPTLDWFV